MLVYEIALMAVLNAIVDTIIVLVILSKRQERMLGVEKVTNKNGESIYAPLGPDGEPVQVPIGTKEVDGQMVAIMGYAPLAYTLPFMAAKMASDSIKMSLLNAKSNISNAIKNRALAEGDAEALMGMLPKKVQGAIAIAKMLGIGIPKGGGEQGQSPRSGSGKAI